MVDLGLCACRPNLWCSGYSEQGYVEVCTLVQTEIHQFVYVRTCIGIHIHISSLNCFHTMLIEWHLVARDGKITMRLQIPVYASRIHSCNSYANQARVMSNMYKHRTLPVKTWTQEAIDFTNLITGQVTNSKMHHSWCMQLHKIIYSSINN